MEIVQIARSVGLDYLRLVRLGKIGDEHPDASANLIGHTDCRGRQFTYDVEEKNCDALLCSDGSSIDEQAPSRIGGELHDQFGIPRSDIAGILQTHRVINDVTE